MRPTPTRVHRRKAAAGDSLPVSCRSPISRLDPSATSAPLNSSPRSGRSALSGPVEIPMLWVQRSNWGLYPVPAPSDLPFQGYGALLTGASTEPLRTGQLSRRTNWPRRPIPSSPPLSEGRGSLNARAGFPPSRKNSLLRPSLCCHR
ncbi:hypothetical protein ebA88 [Aromatoleum aromaticum EbN1]|uniref:Uncharacterized protein n=1 Tax=Aromatoleum aromaticum (strain DSM 19018 / LMG 30748 / EbN1) TaxID=76114 RepID=Q5P940_AROAE|nr:hypothetical protein ebA88 [Aromatoleum aromaticum EbN1]